VNFPDGTRVVTHASQAVAVITKDSLPTVEVDLEINEISRDHSMGIQIPIAKGGDRVRIRVALPDGSAGMVGIDDFHGLEDYFVCLLGHAINLDIFRNSIVYACVRVCDEVRAFTVCLRLEANVVILVCAAAFSKVPLMSRQQSVQLF
jgi:hypothetical protein